MKNIKHTYSLLCLVLITLLLVACKKEKLDALTDNRFTTENRQSSNVRIINLGGYSQVIANGDTLTNYLIFGPSSLAQYPATTYFPGNGRLGKTWTIPQDLFNAQQKANINLAIYDYNNQANRDVKLNITYDQNTPRDYYLLFTLPGVTTNVPVYTELPRAISTPSRPDYFKIRIVNFSDAITAKSSNASGSQEDLDGTVTLAYADGTPVNTQTSNIAKTKASEYIEVPYGTYQFKVLTANGRQFPGTGSGIPENGIIDPPTSTLAITDATTSNMVYAPMQTFQPGGIYTIVVCPQTLKYYFNDRNEDSNIYQNAFQIISDNSPSANLTYCRTQAVNAVPQQQISFSVGGTALGNQLAFGTASDYANLVNGDLEVNAKDASGKIVASGKFNFRAAQNYTVWLYPDANNTPKLVLVANDLSGAVYNNTATDDATYGYSQSKYYFNRRYLNFSGSNPYITFTTNNGQPSGINLQPGVPQTDQPYVAIDNRTPAFDVMAYRSTPTVVPGIWAQDIPVLTSDMFIANKQIYTNAGRKLPAHEPGVFTVALIGQSGTGVADASKARMIILKHNK